MLETFAVEPVPPDWPLLQLDNVTLTPHIAGASVRTVSSPPSRWRRRFAAIWPASRRSIRADMKGTKT